MSTKKDTVILVTFGRFSKCTFMLASDYQAWLQTIDPKERGCVMVVQTDIDPADVDFIERSQAIITRCENEAEEAAQRIADRLKSRKQRVA